MREVRIVKNRLNWIGVIGLVLIIFAVIKFTMSFSIVFLVVAGVFCLAFANPQIRQKIMEFFKNLDKGDCDENKKG